VEDKREGVTDKKKKKKPALLVVGRNTWWSGKKEFLCRRKDADLEEEGQNVVRRCFQERK